MLFLDVCWNYLFIYLSSYIVFNAVILSLLAVVVFAIVTDGQRSGFRVSNGISFYLELLNVALLLSLVALALYDVLLSRKPGGDPTMADDPNAPAVTFNNPGFREGKLFFCSFIFFNIFE